MPAQIQIGAVRSVPTGLHLAVAEAGEEKSPDLTQRQSKPTGREADDRTVPVRPSPISPSDASVISDWSVVFSWKSSPGKAFYRLQVSNRPTFTKTNLDTVTASKSYKTITELAPGVYYWRVKAMNAYKKSSAWSRVQKFTVSVMSPSNITTGNFINRGETSTFSPSVSLAIAARSYVGIAGYFVSEKPAPPDAKASGWAAVTPPALLFSSAVPYTLSNGDGTKTVYVWFKDIDDRVSASTAGSIILDTRPPEAMIMSQPSLTSDFAPASFAFASSMAGATFECSLDSRGYSACSSPMVYKGLTEGSHTFRVKAILAARNVKSSPTSYTWAVVKPVKNTMPPSFINQKGSKYLITNKTVNLSLSAVATTDKKVAGYFVSERPDAPSASDPDWREIEPPVKEFSKQVPFTLSDGNGTKRIYIWFKDTEDNISEVKSDKIVYFSSKQLLIIFLLLQAVFII